MTNQNNIKEIDEIENFKNEALKNIEWDRGIEMILCRWGDHAKCYYWLSYNSHLHYYRTQSYISLPIMILSTIIGAASFVNVSSFSESMQLNLPLIIGGINIYIGILTTIQQYFKISENNENFRLCAKAWDKFNRDIELELSKHPSQRKSCGLFVKKIYDDYERLVDTTPNFPSSKINEFKNMYNKSSYTQNDMRGVNLPGVLYTIYPTENMRNSWYLDTRNKKPFFIKSDAEEKNEYEDEEREYEEHEYKV